MSDFYRTPEWRYLRECVFAYWGERCLKCGDRKNIHVDHVIPRSKAMHLSLDFHNLQPLCEYCNLEKSNKSCADYRDPKRLNPCAESIELAMIVRRKQAYEPWLHKGGPERIGDVLMRHRFWRRATAAA